MKSRLERFIIVLKFFSDVLIIAGGFITAYVLKFKTAYYPHAQVEPYLDVLPLVIVLWLIAFAAAGLYRTQRGLLAKMNEMVNILKGCLLGTFEVMAFTFIYRDFPESRYVIFYSFLIIGLFMTISRLLIFKLQEFWHTKGIGSRRAIVIGANDIGQVLAEKMLNYAEMGYILKGFLVKRRPSKIRYYLKNRFEILGKPAQFIKHIEQNQINAVFVAEDIFDKDYLLELIDYCHQNSIELNIIPNLFEIRISHMGYYELDGIPLIQVRMLRFPFYKKIIKRSLDLVLGAILLLLVAPVMLLIAILIKISSPGPVFYSQKRVTEGEKVFDFLKFRSMIVNAEQSTGPVFTTSESRPKTTSIGRLLRKTSLDELPQLINVLKGEMSLVGPRPERPFFVNKYKKNVKNYHERFLVKGGITGWAQVNGRAALTLNPAEKLSYDLFYIENWSLLLDIQIMLKTIIDVILQKEVY